MPNLNAKNQRRRVACASAMLSAAVSVCAFGQESTSPVADDRATADPANRIVHHFDFNERDQGNLEDVPKFWEPFRPRLFPHFAYGMFDVQTGHQAPPSFHLTSEGRNVAYQYRGPQTRVRANTEYRIEGFIRPDRLRYGRACLSAQFLDRFGRTIGGTLVRSRFIGGPSDSADWTQVDLFLAPAPPRARSIALIAWVLQDKAWNTAVAPRRHIVRNDVFGGAWFDDITIYTLPHATLRSSSPGNVLVADESANLEVILADYEDAKLEGLLTIKDAEGREVEAHTIAVAYRTNITPSRIGVGHLDPGLYLAELDVFSQRKRILKRVLRFATVAGRYSPPATLSRAFGIVIDPHERSDPETEFSLLLHQVARSVKLPMWTGLPDAPLSTLHQQAADRLMQALAKNSFTLIGVFAGAPASIVRASGAYVRPLIELLNDDPAAWQEHLAVVVAPNAGVFRMWQLGPDVGGVRSTTERLSKAVDQIRSAMRRFITAPQLAVVETASAFDKDTPRLVDHATLSFGSDTPPDAFSSAIESEKARGYQSVSVFVEPHSADRFRRIPRLADWAQRIIAARHAGAQVVYVPQTWRVRETTLGRWSEPTEDYLVLRTIADLLAATEPGPRLTIAEGVHALAFERGEETILALWDESASLEGRKHVIQLGTAKRAIDLWGRTTSLDRDEKGRHIVTLSPLPLFIDGIESWLPRFRAAVALTPTHIESGTDIARFTLTLGTTGSEAVSGNGSLLAPDGWRVLPRRFSFSLLPRRSEHFDLEVRVPHSEPAGQRHVTIAITLREGDLYLEVPRTVDLDLSDVEVSGIATVERGSLILRHMVTNRSEVTLSFRGSAYVPGRERQYRPLANLRPGDSQVVEYRFADGADLVGRGVRLVLSEMADGPRVHNLRLTVP